LAIFWLILSLKGNSEGKAEDQLNPSESDFVFFQSDCIPSQISQSPSNPYLITTFFRGWSWGNRAVLVGIGHLLASAPASGLLKS